MNIVIFFPPVDAVVVKSAEIEMWKNHKMRLKAEERAVNFGNR